jgi:hypothetical protein
MKLFLIATLLTLIKISIARSSCSQDGWILIHDKCYYISKFSEVWQAARAICSAENSTLFVIDNERELNNVMLHVVPNKSHFYWVGLNDLEEKHVFVWEDGRTTDIHDPLFKPGQFEDLESIHDGCVNIDSVSIYLEAWECDDPSYFICEKEADRS